MTLAESSTTGTFGLEPLDASAGSAGWNQAAPWKIPAGFTQTVVSGEADLNLYDGRVITIDLANLQASNFVKPGVNVPVEISTPGNPAFQTGFDNPGNLAESPDGKLVIIEDNVPSDTCFAGRDHDNDGAADDGDATRAISPIE